MTETLDNLRRRARELADAGARVFDAPALDFVLALCDRAEVPGGRDERAVHGLE